MSAAEKLPAVRGARRRSILTLIEEASRQSMWLRSRTGLVDVCFSPEELRHHVENGRYVWPAADWQMVAPVQIIADLAEKVQNVSSLFSDTVGRIRGWYLMRVHDDVAVDRKHMAEYHKRQARLAAEDQAETAAAEGTS